MERYAWTARILDGMKEEYVRRHDEIWPELVELLKSAGFTKFLGFSTDGAPWATLSAGQARLGRIMLTGKNLSSNAAWFAEMFDAATVLDPARG